MGGDVSRLFNYILHAYVSAFKGRSVFTNYIRIGVSCLILHFTEEILDIVIWSPETETFIREVVLGHRGTGRSER